MVDFIRRDKAVCIANKPSREIFRADFGQVRCIRTIVAANHDEHVEGFIQELEEGVLSILRGSADRVEVAEVCSAAAIALCHGLTQQVLNGLCFAAQHGGLVRHADALEVLQRIEARAYCSTEGGEKFGRVAAIDHVVGHFAGLLEIQHDHKMSGSITAQSPRGCGSRLLMCGLAMNDRSDPLGGILPDAFPDAHHISAGCIYDLATMSLHCVDYGHLGSECWHNDDIISFQVLQVRIGRVCGEMLNAERIHLGIHIRVVNDFTQKKNPLVGKNLPCRIGQIDGPLNAVAKTEFLCQSDSRVPDLKHPALRPDLFHQFAAIVFFNLCLHMGHDIRRADIDSVWRAQSGIRINGAKLLIKLHRRPFPVFWTPLRG